MNNLPEITVQIIHIQGPLKGEIQEFSDSKILIGRKSACHVRFSKDLSTISRLHAELVREGNRFKVIDKSSNGTFVNGKEVKEHFLKDGDVLMFAEGGPKVSFLTQLKESMGEPPIEPSQNDISKPGVSVEIKEETKPSLSGVITGATSPAPQPEIRENKFTEVPAESLEVSVKKVQIPFTIQFGPTLRSFNELPITIGNNPACDYHMDHSMVLPQHMQIFFSQDQYWAKDLTGKNLVSINSIPVSTQAPLTKDCTLSLSPKGPKFQFIGQGRLVEVEEPVVPEKPVEESPVPENHALPKNIEDKGPKAILKKFWQR